MYSNFSSDSELHMMAVSSQYTPSRKLKAPQNVPGEGEELEDMMHDDLISPGIAASRYRSLMLEALLQFSGEGEELEVMTHDDYRMDHVHSNDSSPTEESSIETCIDSEIWFPSEAEDPEDDIESGVAIYDDIEKWPRGVFMSHPGDDEQSWSYRIKNVIIRKLIVDGKAKFMERLTDHLMHMGVSGDNIWLDIVTELSWEAVSYLTPDAFLGKVVNPNSYVKVKCIATSSQNQSKAFERIGLKIFLKGSHSDELKRIKVFVQALVFLAYDLIREALFYLKESVTRKTIFSNCNESLKEHKDDITAVLGSRGLSVSISRRNATRGTACKQSLSDIKLYRNFDMPIHFFLVDDLFNQKLLCGTCNELPEAHIHYFTHHDKRFTVQVKRLPSDKQLPGANEGKLWTWGYCHQCKKSTKRALLPARILIPSFRKILKNAFKDSSSWERILGCGHLQKDVSAFLGLGYMVAMIRYSRVPAYSVSLPLRNIEFSDSMEGHFLQKEVEDVHHEGRSIFAEVEDSLKKMEDNLVGSTWNLEGSCKRLSDIKEMLKQEQHQFEVDMSNVSANKRYKPLHLNHIHWKLSLHSHIWDQRFSSLERMVATQTCGKKKSCFEEKDTSVCGGYGVRSLKSADPQGWMWRPFSEIESIYLKDRQEGYLPRYEASSSHKTESVIYKRIIEEGSRLHFPVGGTNNNHIVSDYEDELSSIIACALASPEDRKKSSDVISYQSLQNISSFRSLDWCCFNFLMGRDGSSFCNPSEESVYSIFDGLQWLDRSSYLHPVISMGRSANRAKYSVACLFPKEFLHLRSQCGLSEVDYISSLSRCKPWDAKGGKSKCFFAKTLDDRFIIKQINSTEFYSFHEFGLAYFPYMNNASETCLAKILGVYQVTDKKSGAKYDLMVQENIAYGRKFARLYDLKGALYGRFNPATDGAGEVLLDQNFVFDMNVSPLHVNWKAECNLQQAVWNDTSFLHFINVMDYSLLVGVDAENEELVCGIIDYVRPYTLDKQLESLFKTRFVVPKNHLPTIIPPEEYKKRFRMSVGYYVNDPISGNPLQEYKKVHPLAQICSGPTTL
ncbi:hypothetical protein L2E82_43389 [Cichorium intybus]|uniref:Uncharacterized protein n=1 Tax=Cichorium intybus TaxID=13427 RepID=A0ACB8ZPJ5_CICIN|nr:hypothetical protein L2E82_43389 [Cichorium intybus]